MYKLLHLLFLFPIMTMNAQIHEVGVFLGGGNYIGDIGSTTYIAPNKPAFGLLYKWNASPRHAYRFSYTQSKIIANDADSKEPSRQGRGIYFENSIKEVSLGLEFNFFDFSLVDFRSKFTPYIYSGVSGFITDNEKKGKTAIPMIIGIKSNINNSIIIGLETGFRYAFSDNLDKDKSIGNTNNNDWYVFTGLTVTYTLRNRPCHCGK